MSYLLRWVRQNQSLASRSAAIINNHHWTTAQPGQHVGMDGLATTSVIGSGAIKPLYQISTASIRTRAPLLAPKYNDSPPPNSPPKDNIEYTIKFKEQGWDVKKIFKQFYSLYGPLFIACHISVSLASLGFFCSLVWFTIDLTQILPELIVEKIGEKAAEMGESGGKFVIAYAVHKMLLPVRLFGSISLTRFLSRMIISRRGTATK